MNREEKVEAITEMCSRANCSEKIAKIHYDQYVNRDWHPHPPDTFTEWWRFHDDHVKHGVKVKPAWNCQSYRDEFMEAKQYGAA